MAQNVAQKSTGHLQFKAAFSSFSVDNIEKAKTFYKETLGLDVHERTEGLELDLAGGQTVFIYAKPDHQPATFTVLNFLVDAIAAAVEQLRSCGIDLESYGGEIATDENGIMWGKRKGNGPNVAWFRDPAGNYLSVVES